MTERHHCGPCNLLYDGVDCPRHSTGLTYRDGLMKAAEILRNAAAEYDANDSRKVHYNIADEMAATLLRS